MYRESEIDKETHEYLIKYIKKEANLSINPSVSQDTIKKVAGVVLSKVISQLNDNSELICLLKKMIVSKKIQKAQLLRMISLLEDDRLLSITEEEHMERGFDYYDLN